MTLQRVSVQWRRSFHQLESCCGCADGNAPATMIPISIGSFLGATTAVSEVVHTVAAECERLRVHVLPFDRVLFGDTFESVDELVVRGQLFVVMTCLRHLREVMPPPSILRRCMDPVPDLLHAFPGGPDEVLKFAELEYHRITSIWTQLRRRDERVPDGLTSSIVVDDKRLRRTALLAAQCELHALIDHPRLGAFLRTGINHRQLLQVRTACVRVATALQVRLSAELVLPLWRAEVAGSAGGTWCSTTQQPVDA